MKRPSAKRRPAARKRSRRVPNPVPKHRAPSDATARDLDALADGGIDGGAYGEHAVFVSHPAYFGPDDTRVIQIVRGKWEVATYDSSGMKRRRFASRAAAYHYAKREHPAAAPKRNPATRTVRTAKPRTYAEARALILGLHRDDGWDVRENLKVPHATTPNGDFRLWFKTQAIYFTTCDRRRGCGSLSDARSIGIGDIRTMPLMDVLAHIDRVRMMETRGR